MFNFSPGEDWASPWKRPCTAQAQALLERDACISHLNEQLQKVLTLMLYHAAAHLFDFRPPLHCLTLMLQLISALSKANRNLSQFAEVHTMSQVQLGRQQQVVEATQKENADLREQVKMQQRQLASLNWACHTPWDDRTGVISDWKMLHM